jgi:hypothetical protein
MNLPKTPQSNFEKNPGRIDSSACFAGVFHLEKGGKWFCLAFCAKLSKIDKITLMF